MPEHRIRDRSGRMVEISGELIGRASSQTSSKPRWAEYELYRTDSGAYVVSTVGRSAVPGERDFPEMRIAETPEAVIRALTRTHQGVTSLPYVARLLLDDAATRDPAIRAVHPG